MKLFHFKKREQEKTTDVSSVCSTKNDIGAEEHSKVLHTVKVLGTGCRFCREQYENAQKAVKEAGIPVKVEYVTDLQEVMQYGVMEMPALVVDGTVVSAGKVLKPDDVAALLHSQS